MLIILTARFEQETLHFESESDQWKVEYVTDVVTSDHSERGTIEIKYLVDNEVPIEIEYNIEGGSGGISGVTEMEDRTLKIPSSNWSGCSGTKR